jgi:hypothetical protein
MGKKGGASPNSLPSGSRLTGTSGWSEGELPNNQPCYLSILDKAELVSDGVDRLGFRAGNLSMPGLPSPRAGQRVSGVGVCRSSCSRRACSPYGRRPSPASRTCSRTPLTETRRELSDGFIRIITLAGARLPAQR